MQTIINHFAMLVVLGFICIFAAFTFIGLFLLFKKEEGTVNPVKLYHSLIAQLKTQHLPNVPFVTSVPVTNHPLTANKQHPTASLGICKICGCTDDNACIHPNFGSCYWLNNSTQDLCSHCVELKGDPSVERPNPKLRAKMLKKLLSLKSL